MDALLCFYTSTQYYSHQFLFLGYSISSWILIIVGVVVGVVCIVWLICCIRKCYEGDAEGVKDIVCCCLEKLSENMDNLETNLERLEGISKQINSITKPQNTKQKNTE